MDERKRGGNEIRVREFMEEFKINTKFGKTSRTAIVLKRSYREQTPACSKRT